MVARPSRQNGKPIIYLEESVKLELGGYIHIADAESEKVTGSKTKRGYEGAIEYLIGHHSKFPVVTRPWGSFQIVYQSESLQTTVKIIRIDPMGKLSLQKHEDRSEIWRLLKGKAIATVEGTKVILDEDGDTMLARANEGQIHRLESEEGAVILEIAEGHFSEYDIIRLEDAYGRVVKK